MSPILGVSGAALLFAVYGLLTRGRNCFGCSLRTFCDSDRASAMAGGRDEDAGTTEERNKEDLAKLESGNKNSSHDGDRHVRIEIYGPGCSNCKRLEQQTREAVAQLGQPAEIVKVEDIMAMSEAGVMRTPALGIDGKLVLQGRVPGVQELSTIIAKVRDGLR